MISQINAFKRAYLYHVPISFKVIDTAKIDAAALDQGCIFRWARHDARAT
jgi:hypothetical protein